MHPVARYSQIRSHAQSFRRVAKRSWLGSITDRGRSVGMVSVSHRPMLSSWFCWTIDVSYEVTAGSTAAVRSSMPTISSSVIWWKSA